MKASAGLMTFICLVFYIGYFYHFYECIKLHDKYFENRINPAAFTAYTDISDEMWQKVEKEYKDLMVEENGIPKTNFLMLELEKQIP